MIRELSEKGSQNDLSEEAVHFFSQRNKNMIEAEIRSEYSKSNAAKKELGQYFTGLETADYMAEMIQPVSASVICILDAGAGAGVLTFSASMRCLKLGHNRIHAVLYEIDKSILPQLKTNMSCISQIFKNKGGEFTFRIYNRDFVLSRPDRLKERFHISSINPPYFKYNSKTSLYAGATQDLYKGNPNIYASFVAITAECLNPKGQMAAIVPRSFASGLYFKDFRRYMRRNMSLDQIHIFKSRDEVFKQSNVLQENIICYYTKQRQKSHIKITASVGYSDLKDIKTANYPANQIIDTLTGYEIIRIPETSEDAEVLRIVEHWPSDFQKNNYFISTGPVVEYRMKNYITQLNQKNKTMPLLKMHNIKPFKRRWVEDIRKDVYFRFFKGHEKYTLKNQVYVLLKRFSSKDERRRLIASVHDPDTIKSHRIAMENHVNYIGSSDGLLEITEAYGLAALFNSTFMDKYFRCLSGNTQVNATEIKLMKMPSRNIICQIGKSFFENNILINQNNIDNIVNFYLEKIVL